MFYKTLTIAFAVIGTQAVNLQECPTFVGSDGEIHHACTGRKRHHNPPGANGGGINPNDVGGSGTYPGLAQTEIEPGHGRLGRLCYRRGTC